jgi:HPt (histidine-containing phosphotransfer) domain-containing protein
MDKYIQLFISSSPPIIEKINLALTVNDFEEIANQVHGYKTKCIMMGMADTKELANRIEQLCREGSNASRIKEDVLNFISHIDKALIELNNFSIEQTT